VIASRVFAGNGPLPDRADARIHRLGSACLTGLVRTTGGRRAAIEPGGQPRDPRHGVS
jgi:hypothetical protein